jgi:hypothetical protein
MADITYTVNQDNPDNIPGFENFSQADIGLIKEYQINTLFDTNKHFAELHITDLTGEIIESDYNYSSYKLLGIAQSAGKEGASILTIDPIQDANTYGYSNGGVKLLYHFLNDPYTQDKTKSQFFIKDISPDRTEVLLQNLNISTEDLVNYTTEIRDRLNNQSYFNEFRLNFENNDLLIGLNIDTLTVDGNVVVAVKLYEPLPLAYDIKSVLYVNELISDSVAFEVDAQYQFPEELPNTIRPANFNLDITDNQVIPTQYLNYTDLFSYPVNNTNNQLYSLVSEKGAELSIDHTDYSDFVHFSSAYERLVNFKYKLQLIESYNTSLGLVQAATSQSVGTTGSVSYYENLITGVVNNFDHYERYLYYQSSSYAWPKSNSTVPYVNYPSTSSQAINWYANQLAVANKHDLSNGSILINSIPTYLRDDPNNENYLTFTHMIGQHFDNLWIYAKAVTDKYDGDNRLDFGISKDLVGEALRNFGVKLYTSNKSIENLFGSFIGEGYQSGSEDINTYVTGSVTGSGLPITDVSFDDYTKEVQKRIYHNLPFIVKTKGTERGVRALINCFGIPPDTLKIKLYGGRNTNERPFYGDYRYYTSSLDKIRLDNTGSLISGSTLSQYTSIYKRDTKYTDDLHKVEVGFSPTDNIDNLIVSYSLATASLSSFNIDDYIGDPRSLYSSEYGLLNASGSIQTSLEQITNRIMSSSAAYDVKDYVRLIKFFDNVIFKMVRDYVPARTVADTGIIIKPHLLQRNKAKSPFLSGSRPEHSGSIDTAFIESTDGETFGGRNNYSTAYSESIQTPTGLRDINFLHGQEQPKYNGEFNGSTIDPTNGELNEDNPYKDLSIGGYNFGEILYVSSSNERCLLSSIHSSPLIITSSTFNLTANYLFSFTREATIYSTSSTANATGSGTPGNPYSITTLPFNLLGYGNYDQFYISASSPDVAEQPCASLVLVRFATCSLFVSPVGNTQVNVRQGTSVPSTNLTTWFTINSLQTQVQYTASYDSTTVGIPNPTTYYFTQDVGTSVTITAVDPYSSNCQTSVTVTVGQCAFASIPTGSNGLEFDFSEYGGICPPSAVLDPNQAPVGLDIIAAAAQDSVANNQLNGAIFNQYGTPVDPCIGFLPKYLQRPNNTLVSQFGTPPSGYTLQSFKDRGLQSYLSPYCPVPTQGLEIPPSITFNVYMIMNDNDNNLESDTKYIHTVTNPTGSDNYRAELIYTQIGPSDLGIQSTLTAISTALGTGINVPQPPDIAGSGSNSPYQQLVPVYVVTPPKNYLTLPNSQGTQLPYTYSTGNKTLAREKLPVAYHIQAISADGISCISSVTVYPNFYTRILSPPAVSGLTVSPFSAVNWSPVSSTQKYIFVDKVALIGESQYIWGPSPVGVSTVTVPIRKRALV